MKTLFHAWRRIAPAFLVTMSLGATACSVDRTPAPSLAGPSEFGLAVTMTASPDQLPRDGSSQSVVTLTARDANGKAVAGQRFTLGAAGASGVAFSASDVTTGSSGQATFLVTAPPSDALGNSITVQAVPVGENFQNAVARTLTIALLGPSNTTAPTASFTTTPANPEVQQVVTFDGSASTDEGGLCGTACTYSWDFDDGSTATGVQTTHTYSTARNYNVALTVRDAAGLTSVRRQLVAVIAPAAPTVTVSVAPNPPLLNQAATFTASAAAAANHSVRQYVWNFGDGTTTTSTVPSVTKTYSTASTFVVTVTATDDLGQNGIGTISFTVGTGITISFTISPTSPHANQTTFFNASATASSAGATISSYSWDFGDGGTGTGIAPSHTYTAAGTYVVRLTVTDSGGRTATATQNVTVQ